jgi:hypothetical protein
MLLPLLLSVAWLSVVVVVLAACQAAARGDAPDAVQCASERLDEDPVRDRQASRAGDSGRARRPRSPDRVGERRISHGVR